jgi:glycosyltransferase involved in cell wall biosynthesis
MTGTDYNSEMQPDMQTALSGARALIVFHAEGARSVQARFPELADRLYVIPQAVEVPERNCCSREDVRSRWDLSFEEVVFFMAAGLRPVKNIGYALESFARFRQKNPRARLLLAGPRLDAQESDRVLALGKSTDGFEYCGELPHTQVLELMSAADIFLNTSLSEGMSGAVMEAMAAGRAVIATDVTGNRALIESMRTGILVPLQAPEALLGACETLAADVRLRLRLGDEARRFVSEFFCCETELQAYEELYASVLTR